MADEWLNTHVRDLWDGEMVGARAGPARVLLVCVEGEVCAYHDRCAHQGIPLSEGRLDGGRLRCRAHGWTYDARTGRGINPDNVALHRLAVRRQAGKIWVCLEGTEERGDDD